ncbi:carbonic anhydrase [Isosphaeraceae bacterium EP7]
MLDIIYRYDPRWGLERLLPVDAADARRMLEQGNREFAQMVEFDKGDESTTTRIVPIDLEELGVAPADGTAPLHSPFAVVLGCSDARVPTELIFHQSCNDMFVVRVAGHVLGSECLGSIDYAIGTLAESLKVVVVLGHSRCGAITAAVDTFLAPANYLSYSNSHHLRSILDRLLSTVQGAAKTLVGIWGDSVVERPGYRDALIEMSVTLNAAVVAHTLRREYPQQGDSRIEVVFGVYDLVTRKVGARGLADEAEEGDSHLGDPPENLAEFLVFSSRLARHHTIRKLLELD